MRTSFNIPKTLLEQAVAAAETDTKSQAIVIALTELIQRRKSRDLLKLKGSLPEGFEYKSNRRKR